MIISKQRLYIVIGLIIACGLALWIFWPKKHGYPYERGAIMVEGQAFNTFIAHTAKQHQTGLRAVPELEDDEAMLFIFENEVTIPFTMRGMNYPIHIIFLNQDGMVLGGRVNAQPGQEFIYAPEPYRYVIELPIGVKAPQTGMIIKLNIKDYKYE